MRSVFFLIFISGFLCFCKSSGYENKSTQDASKDPVKASMLGNDLPKDLRSEVNYFQTCKETIKVCSASKKTANKCDWASFLVEHFPNEDYRTNSVVGVANPKICQENQACISYYLSCKYPLIINIKHHATYAPEIQILLSSGAGMTGESYRECYMETEENGCFSPEEQLEGHWHIVDFRVIKYQSQIVFKLQSQASVEMQQQNPDFVYRLFTTSDAQHIPREATWRQEAVLLFQ